MACNPSNCQSNCYGNEEKAEVVVGEEYVSANQNQNLCIKCKTKEPIGGDEGRMFCIECFRSNLYGKFRLAVTSHAMITPTDNVLVAFSGGPSSRVALQFVHELQHKSLKNFDASRDRSLPVFGVGVAFIDETTISSLPSHDIDRAIQDIRLIVSNLAPPIKQLHVVPIENIYSGDGTNRLKNLLDAVSDTTGKEDLLLHLRMLTLQKVASESGYNKIVLGLCTSRIACHVISATVKGQGYSLPADIQYVDSRWEIPIVLPLRDCLVQELNMLCHLDGLETVEFKGPCSGINGLVSSFVRILQEENPSRECTIVRTAGKLTPFHFNRIPESDDSVIPLATRRRQKRYNLKPNESISSESFCPICNSPLNKSDMLRLSNLGSCQTRSDRFGAACCSSCRFQILPKDPSSIDHFYSLLPQPLVARAKHSSYDNLSLLREQIQDCLLSRTVTLSLSLSLSHSQNFAYSCSLNFNLSKSHMAAPAVEGTAVAALRAVMFRVRQAAERSGRKPDLVRVVAVSKTKPVSLIRQVYDSGYRCFGENYAQELIEKAPQLPQDIDWHFIGHLQSNKVKSLLTGVPNLAMVEGVDNAKVANHLDRAVSSLGRNPLKVLVQVNTSGEASKSGIDPSDCVELAKHVKLQCPNLEFSGLMTIGMPDYSSTPENFRTLSNCRIEVCKALAIAEEQCELSMGMSGDFELAIEMGSTNVRVGSTIFGPREYAKKQPN